MKSITIKELVIQEGGMAILLNVSIRLVFTKLLLFKRKPVCSIPI
jgi:hypothetical protein